MINNNISATPTTATSLSTTSTTMSNPVKAASPDIVIFNDAEIESNAEAMVDLLFENIGGQELLTIARYDTVNGQEVLYQPIKNLNIIQEEYNPNNILKLQKTSDKIFGNYPIKLDPTIPDPYSQPGIPENVYLDADGNVVIELINLVGNEQVEVEIATNGTIYNIDLTDNEPGTT
jgi:hypothetical protein